MLRLTYYADQNAVYAGDLMPQADFINAKSLAATTQKSDTIPAGAKSVLVTSSTTCYFRIGAVASIPGDTADGSSAELLLPVGFTFREIVTYYTTGSITTGTALLTVASTDGLTIGQTVTVAGAGVAGAVLSQTISAINTTTNVVTLGGNASTTVTSQVVTMTPTIISVISPSVCVVTLAYYK